MRRARVPALDTFSPTVDHGLHARQIGVVFRHFLAEHSKDGRRLANRCRSGVTAPPVATLARTVSSLVTAPRRAAGPDRVTASLESHSRRLSIDLLVGAGVTAALVVVAYAASGGVDLP